MVKVTISQEVVDWLSSKLDCSEEVKDNACGFCDGEGEYIVHFALDSAENIYETCPICKGGLTNSLRGDPSL